jgi:hypothetical protein
MATRRTALVGVWIALTVPQQVVASAAPPAEPLKAYVVDGPTYPSVLIDAVIPWRFRTSDIDSSMVELDDGTVESVSRVDPTTSVVGLVIDDGPTVATGVVYAAQGSAVELVRNVGRGTAIALSTPSGLLTAPTTDRGATIARIAGITAGAPDVVSLPRLVLDAAERLTALPWPDRNLVVVLGRPLRDGPPLTQLAEVAAEANIRVHVVADPGVDDGPMARIAESTGGLAAGAEAMLAEVDQVTEAIAHRVRVAATVTRPGAHELVLDLGGVRFTAQIDIPAAPSAVTTAAPPADDATSTAPRADVATSAAPAAATTVASTFGASSRITGSRDVERATPTLIAGALAIAVGMTIVWRRRPARRPAGSRPATSPPPAPAAAEAMLDPVRKSRSRPARMAPTPARNVTAASGPGYDTAGVAGGPGPVPGETRSDRAQLGPRRAQAERPRRATPRRRPSGAPPTDVELPEPEEHSVEADEWLVAGRIRLSRTTGEVFSGARRVALTPTELAVLELLMTRGGQGVTRDAIRATIGSEDNGHDTADLDVTLAELRRKTGIRGRRQGVRQERTLVYFFGD